MRSSNIYRRMVAGIMVVGIIAGHLFLVVFTLRAQPPKDAPAKSPVLASKEPSLPTDKPRRYADGPLSADDFRMPPPNPIPTDAEMPMAAMTYTELRYSYSYRSDEKNGRATAWAVDVNVFAVLDRARSWNIQPQSARILDHEQGHFDIAEIHARRAAEKVKKNLADRKYFGRGKTEADARADLESQLNKEFDTLVAQLMSAQKDYDRATQHGLITVAQADARKTQKEQLAATAPKEEKPKDEKPKVEKKK